MYTSLNKKEYRKKAYKYFLISLGVLGATILYEQFAHGVTSNYMRTSFLFPLIGGSLVCLMLINQPQPSILTSRLWQMGITTFVVGFFLMGVFEIYGSIENLVYIYFYIGGGLLILALLMYIFTVIIEKLKTNN